MVRILHYIGLLELGGSQAFVMELYRNIDRKKMQFDFVTFPNQKGELYDQIAAFGGRVYESPKYNGKNHVQFVHWWDDFLTGHSEYKVLHGHVRSVASIYLPIARKHGCFTILHSHGASNGRGISGIIKFLLQIPVRYQADYYMACSDDAGRWLFGKKVVRGRRYAVVPNAINPERFAFDPEKRSEMRQRYGLENNFVIGHVGRFVSVKNHDFLLDILKEALRIDRNARLLLVGDGKRRSSVEEKCDEMGLAEYVIFVGSRMDAENFYQAMDAFAFPSFWEGLGIAVIEAQANGLPCIISEGVPQSVDIKAGLIQRQSLQSGAKAWADRMMSVKDTVRSSPADEIKAAGYDIRNNAVKMQKFYFKVDANVKKEVCKTECTC